MNSSSLALAANSATAHVQLIPLQDMASHLLEFPTRINGLTPLVAGRTGLEIAADGSITIDEPGSYYLTESLTVDTTANGITILADNVTLDLNGFSLICTNGNGGSGIHVGASRGIHIRNGFIRGGTTLAGSTFKPAGWQNGIKADGASCTRISDITVIGVRCDGISANASGAVAEGCTVDVCGGRGIATNNALNCTVRNAGGDGIAIIAGLDSGTVRNCIGESIADRNGIYAITALVSDSRGESKYGFGLASRSATNCSGSSGSGHGLLATANAQNCFGSSSSHIGLSAASASNCRALSFSGTALSAKNATNCDCISTSGTGLEASTASNCTASTKRGDYGMNISGAASFCHATRPDGTAISAGIAIACTSDDGIILSPEKHLGTR